MYVNLIQKYKSKNENTPEIENTYDINSNDDFPSLS